LLIKFQSHGGEAVPVLIVEPLGMPPRHPQQAGDSLFGDVHEPCRGSDTTAFVEMVDDILRSGCGKLGVE
jgi:hypothetical protein